MYAYKDSPKHSLSLHFSQTKGSALIVLLTSTKHDTIATFHSSDVRLRLLLTQYTRLPFPAATATLLPYTCHCGATHLRLQATDDIPDNAILLIGESAQWQGCLVQFDGSVHKRTKAGGAGVSLLQVTQESTTLVRWKSVPLVNCPDNVVAEAHACLAAVHLAINYHRDCLQQGIAQDGFVIQGDILPLLNYLQGRGRIKRAEVVRILEECQQLLSRAPFIFRLVYLPRECNKLADHFAGIASARAKETTDQPLAAISHRALPPYHLAQKLGFVIEHGVLHSEPAFVLTECPTAAPNLLAGLLQQAEHSRQSVQDYSATAGSNQGTVAVGYKPSSIDGRGRLYAVGNAAQRLPRKIRLLLFGMNHYELDISGAHYELARRLCARAGVHRSLRPVFLTRDWLRSVLTPAEGPDTSPALDALIKRWPLIVINSETPQVQRQVPHLQPAVPPQLARFAHELHAAGRYVMNHPPGWCLARSAERSRAALFFFFEVIEQQFCAGCVHIPAALSRLSLSHLVTRWLLGASWSHGGPPGTVASFALRRLWFFS